MPRVSTHNNNLLPFLKSDGGTVYVKPATIMAAEVVTVNTDEIVTKITLLGNTHLELDGDQRKELGIHVDTQQDSEVPWEAASS
jgi:predicted ABC-type ATPase